MFFMCRFNSFSPGQKAILVVISGIHENPRFPPLSIRGVRVEDCATTEKMIFIPTLKPLAQGGVRFSDFHAPPCADFRTFLSAIDFGAPLAHSARLPSFSNFKLACPLCPPRLHHASTAPRPAPAPPPPPPHPNLTV